MSVFFFLEIKDKILSSHEICTISVILNLFTFLFQKLHLPPELSETASRSQEDPVPSMKPALGCGTGAGKSKLEF